MRCALASDCRKHCSSSGVWMQRLMWRADCALQRLISACTRNVSTSAVAGWKGIQSCSADLMCADLTVRQRQEAGVPQGNKMSSADWWRQLRGPSRGCLTESAVEKHTFQSLAKRHSSSASTDLIKQLWYWILIEQYSTQFSMSYDAKYLLTSYCAYCLFFMSGTRSTNCRWRWENDTIFTDIHW